MGQTRPRSREGVVPKVPGHLEQGPPWSRNCLPEVRPEECVPAHEPWAGWAAVDHPRLGGSTCRQSRRKIGGARQHIPPVSVSSLWQQRRLPRNQCSQSELGSRDPGPPRGWGPEPRSGLFPNHTARKWQSQDETSASSSACLFRELLPG